MALTYANSLASSFVFDDRFTILENIAIRSLSNLPSLFTSDFWAGSGREAQNYRPLVMVTLAMNYALFGLRAWGYHLTNVLIHLASVTGAFYLALRCTNSLGGAMIAAGLVGLHPVQTEAVNALSWRGDLLATAFTLGAITAYGRYTDAIEKNEANSQKRRALFLSWLSLALACLAKETGLTAFGVLVAYDWMYPSKGRWREFVWRLRFQLRLAYLGYLILFLGYLALRTVALGRIFNSNINFVDNPLAFQPYLHQKLLALSLVAHYSWKLLWPSSLSVDYSYNALPLDLSWASAGVICGLAETVLAVSLVVWGRRRSPALAFGALFTLITYSMTANLFFSIQVMMAERFLTLPLFGFALILSRFWKVCFEGERGIRKQLGISIACIVLAFCAARSAMRNRDWRDNITLFEAAVRATPTSAKVHYALGNLYSEGQKDLVRAAKHYDWAINIFPDYYQALSDRSLVLSRLGRHKQAIESVRRAVQLQPTDVLSWNNLGFVLYEAGLRAEAASAWRVAVELNPGFAQARDNLEQLKQQMLDMPPFRSESPSNASTPPPQP